MHRGCVTVHLRLARIEVSRGPREETRADDDAGQWRRAGLLVAQGVEVLCGELGGTLLPGGRRGEEKVKVHSTGLSVSAPDFERAAGRGSTKKWRRSLRVVDVHRAHLNGLCVQDWLVQKVS